MVQALQGIWEAFLSLAHALQALLGACLTMAHALQALERCMGDHD